MEEIGAIPKDFSSRTEFETVKMLKCGKPDAPILHVYFGPYVSDGRTHHDSARIDDFVRTLLDNNFDIEMHHQEADAERVKTRTSGYVRVTNSHNVQLFYCDHFQHDRKSGAYTSDAVEMAKEVLSAAIHVGK